MISTKNKSYYRHYSHIPQETFRDMLKGTFLINIFPDISVVIVVSCFIIDQKPPNYMCSSSIYSCEIYSIKFSDFISSKCFDKNIIIK